MVIPGPLLAVVALLDGRGELLRRFPVTRAPAVLLPEKTGQIRAQRGPDPSQVRALIQEMAKR